MELIKVFNFLEKIPGIFLKVQNPCFVQNLEACPNFDIFVKKSQCTEAMNEAMFERQTIEDVFQNKLFLEFSKWRFHDQK